VTRSGDDYAVMRTTRYTYDDIVEALVRGEGVAGEHASLATFAREVQALGDEPVPTPSADLAALLEGRGAGVARLVSSTGKAAGLGIVAKLGLSASLAAAGVVGAGAAGLLPAAANHAVRGAIEVVTPVQFDEPNEHPATFGDRVSSDATGESDGENGVDGQQISDEAPGADNRNGGSSRADRRDRPDARRPDPRRVRSRPDRRRRDRRRGAGAELGPGPEPDAQQHGAPGSRRQPTPRLSESFPSVTHRCREAPAPPTPPSDRNGVRVALVPRSFG
jgi:hypothetical protein